MRRSFANLYEKFIIHNQKEKVDRLEYLVNTFMKRPLKQDICIAEVHCSVLDLILKLTQSPVLAEVDVTTEKRVYLSKLEFQKFVDDQMEMALKEKTQEDFYIE